jgi:hypothetical protein
LLLLLIILYHHVLLLACSFLQPFVSNNSNISCFSLFDTHKTMHSSVLRILSLISFASSSIIPRADPGFQNIPANGITDNTCSNGKPIFIGLPDQTSEIPPAVYGARSVDLPFSRLYYGSMKFFAPGEYNTPDGITDKWAPGVNDFANQSACGIPDNAFYDSKVAIHPYFLKYADLSRT